jgi:hypothetical protein
MLDVRDAVHPLPTGFPAIGVSTQRPDEASHLRVPQSASVTQMGMQEKMVSSRFTGSHAMSCRLWHLATGGAGGFGPIEQDSKHTAFETPPSAAPSMPTQMPPYGPQAIWSFVQSIVQMPFGTPPGD